MLLDSKLNRFVACSIEEPNHVNILVTGAAGYIGSICAEVLLARGMRVSIPCGINSKQTLLIR